MLLRPLSQNVYTNAYQFKDEATEAGTLSRLVIRKAKRFDTAVFGCRATNRFGSSDRTINLIVQVGGSF